MPSVCREQVEEEGMCMYSGQLTFPRGSEDDEVY